MSKVLVVYYSLTGNTRLIAEAIEESIDADILELKPVKELNAESGMKYFWGGFQATMKRKPKLKDFNINPLIYDLIIVGTPVWAWTFSPPVRSFLSKFNFSGKNIALWTCSDGDGVKAMGKFRDALKESNIIGEIRFRSPKKHGVDEAKEEATAWAKEVIGKI